MPSYFFLPLGGGVRVRRGDVVGVFDLDGKVTPPDTAALLRTAERSNRATLAGGDLPKAFVLLKDGAVIFTTYSAATIHNWLLSETTRITKKR